MSKVNYNFTEEQQELFNQYYAYVNENYSSLFIDPIMKEKTKTILAYAVINGGDLPTMPVDFKPLEEEEENILNGFDLEIK